MAYSEEEKQKALKRIENGDRIKDIAAEMGISIPTLYNWKKAVKPTENKPEEMVEQNETKNEGMVKEEIKGLIGEGKLEEAIQLAEKYPNSAEIQRKRIRIAIMQQDYDTAKQIGAHFKEDEKIQSQMLTIAIREGDNDKIREIKEKFKSNEVIQEQISRVSMYMPEVNQPSGYVDKNAKSNGKEMAQLNRIRTQLYYDKVDNEVIEGVKRNRQIGEFQKVISLLAICEKRKMKNEAKRIAAAYITEDKREKSIIRQILERISTKKSNIFDITKYDDILGWKMDLKLKRQYDDELRAASASKREKMMLATRKKAQEKEAATQKAGTSEQARKKQADRSAMYRRSLFVKTNNTPTRKPTEQNGKKEAKVDSKKQDKIMYDHINKFIREQKKKVYVNMQSRDAKIQADAISKWDRLEVLLEKIAERSQDTAYLESLYNRVVDLENRQGIEL